MELKKGDRIAQLVITENRPIQIIEIEKMETSDTEGRGEGGFGSTGEGNFMR